MPIRHDQTTGLSSELVSAVCFCIQTVNQNVENWYLQVHTESFVCKEQFVSFREFFRLHTEELLTQFVDVPTDFLNCRILVFL